MVIIVGEVYPRVLYQDTRITIAVYDVGCMAHWKSTYSNGDPVTCWYDLEESVVNGWIMSGDLETHIDRIMNCRR